MPAITMAEIASIRLDRMKVIRLQRIGGPEDAISAPTSPSLGAQAL